MYFKKSQLQIQETILVVFIFIIILAIGMIVFYRFSLQGLEEKKFENERLRFNTLLITFPELSEITCSIYSQEANCIDTYKLLAFKEQIDKYKERLGYMNITIYTLYPEKNNILCELSSVRDCGIWNVYYNKPREFNKKIVTETPVSLYYVDGYSIGLLVLERYL